MHSFKDSKGNSWNLVVNVGSAKKVRDQLGIDLFTIFQSDESQKLLSDPVTLVNTLYVLCEDQCSKHTVTVNGNTRPMNDIEFGEAMYGDVIEQATTALLEEIIDFFPQRRQVMLKELLRKSQLATVEMEKKAMESINNLDISTLFNKSTALPELSK